MGLWSQSCAGQDLKSSSCSFWLKSITSLHTSLARIGSGLIYKVGLCQDLARDLLHKVEDDVKIIELYYHIDYGCGAEEEAQTMEETLTQAATDAGEELPHEEWSTYCTFECTVICSL